MGSSNTKATVLLIDDNPSHLQLYSLVLAHGGYLPLTCLVSGSSVPLPRQKPVDVTVLDYRIGTAITAVQVAQQLREAFPKKPIVILSDLAWMPDDIRPYAARFVRKGEPEQMLLVLKELMEA